MDLLDFGDGDASYSDGFFGDSGFSMSFIGSIVATVVSNGFSAGSFSPFSTSPLISSDFSEFPVGILGAGTFSGGKGVIF